MSNVKLTKGELKRQRDALRQYERYLPTLQLKKQQLQMEILRQLAIVKQKERSAESKQQAVLSWAGLLAEAPLNLHQWTRPQEIITQAKNIAGVDVAEFVRAEFMPVEYDLFTTPLWVDAALLALQELVGLNAEIAILEKGLIVLRLELRVTTQRVNLFEKVKIPEAKEAIRVIKIYIGDQTANAVGRSKIAKRKIEEAIGIAV
jgi:V/A-type H+-transporting ATPase subunit D